MTSDRAIDKRRSSRTAQVRPTRTGVLAVLILAMFLSGCGGSGSANTSITTPSSASPSPVDSQEGLSSEAFTDISEEPVPEDLAAQFQAALAEMSDMVGGGGMAATVLSPEGVWSGAIGKANADRLVQVTDQFAIASVTKSIVAAQVMQMVEDGELTLDDAAADHLPTDLGFDANGATIRQLLGQRSGIPSEDWAEVDRRLSSHPRRLLPSTWLLDLVPSRRAPAGEGFEYSNANFILLGLVIEQARGRGLGEVLRSGVLDVEGTQRLIYQPDEAPTEPMALPEERSAAVLEDVGGYLPSLAAASTHAGAAAMASDAPSLAQWWRAFCAGEIVSPESLKAMTTLRDGYGLGLYNVTDGYADGRGHAGEHIDGTYASWAGCLPEHGAVIVVLGNQSLADPGATAYSLATVLQNAS